MTLISIILGTRPEAIKLAPVILKFSSSKDFDLRIISTGQHKEMVQQILKLFDIKPHTDLKLMTEKQTLTHITCKTINGLEKEFDKYYPNLVIVQGDTSTAFSAALAAFYRNIPVAHIEAGLRTSNKINPFPEELNRRMITQIADLHFAPTKLASDNLKKEGIQKNVYITGNTVIDSLLKIASSVEHPKITNMDWENKKIILVTVHRRENWGRNLEEITFAIKDIAKKRKEVNFLIPMHKNKIVRDKIIKELSGISNIFLTDSLNYDELVGAIKNCHHVLTDSGGIQEEAPTFGKPVLILRNTTERQEALNSGAAKLIGTKRMNIFNEVNKILDDTNLYNKMSKSINPFGDGHATEKIYNYCEKFLKEKKISNLKIH
tara:strand:+ start:374 stop:1504 length:1131 start_codon:yes stop_codon:yes gene_type:complete